MLHKEFQKLYDRYLNHHDLPLHWNELQPVSNIPHMAENAQVDTTLLDKVVVLKLNGGLGTTMGCEGPKSLVHVTPDKTFLDIITQQLQKARVQYHARLPLILMNSAFTDKDTHTALTSRNIPFQSFLQHYFPRLDAETKQPISDCYPPGHGDVYPSFFESGLLDQCLKDGFDYVFISNSDNLGATVSPEILTYMKEKELDFLMEVTPKTERDKKGGAIVHYHDQLILIERSQIPPSHSKSFERSNVFHVFNTNSLWLNLKVLKDKITQSAITLPIIVNKKVIHKKHVIQLETAMGAAISCFEKSGLISVNRDRFLPVKSKEDLAYIRSVATEYFK